MSESDDTEKPQSNIPCKRVLKLPEGYEYTELKVSKELIQFYCNNLKTETDIADWVKLFGEISFIEWRVAITYKCLKGIKCTYRIDYRCQHGRFGYAPLNAVRISKVTQCPVRLIIKRVRCNSYSEQLSTLVQLRYNHNHDLGAHTDLRYRDVAEVTKKQLLDLYVRGYSPLSAHEVLHFNAFMAYGSYYVNDRKFLPDVPYCYNLYYKEYKGQIEQKARYSEIKERLQQWVNKTNGYAALKIDNGRLILTLITPLMKRGHAILNGSKEVVYIDKIISQGKIKYCTYVFSSFTVVGQIPLCYIITSTVEPILFNKGLLQLLALDTEVPFFYKQGASVGPQIIVINEDPKSSTVNTLKEFWPNSNIIISFQYIFNFVWKCLNYRNYDAVRKDLLIKLKPVLLAKTEEEYLKLFKSLKSDYPFFYSKVSDLWSFKKMFCLCYHKQKIPFPNNCTISVLQNLKNNFLKFSKFFTLPQLIDFITSKLDDSYCKRLKELTQGHIHVSNLNLYLPKNSISFDKIKRIAKTAFVIKSAEISDCFIDVDLGICTCNFAAQGLFCDHQCAVILYEIKKSKTRNESFSDSDFKALHDVCSEQLHENPTGNDSGPAHEDNQAHGNEIKCSPDDLQHVNKRTQDDLIEEEVLPRKKRKIHVVSDKEIQDNEYIEIVCKEVLNIVQETVDNVTSNIIEQELTPSDVRRIMDIDQNPFSENLRTVFDEITTRVKNNPSLKSAAEDFCNNYKKFCGDGTELKLFLKSFGEKTFPI